nr:diguanylate cyclase [Clostridium aminobutyricum]
MPGNLEIQAEINARIEKETPFATVYADLDNFKAYNDAYGFAKGDMAIKLTADIIMDGIQAHENKDDFIGHIGGDDFIFITSPHIAESICKKVIFQFDKRITELYNKEDLETGYIITVNPLGKRTEYPIMTISLALVNHQPGIYYNHIQLAEIAAELKRRAKAKLGSNLVKC